MIMILCVNLVMVQLMMILNERGEESSLKMKMMMIMIMLMMIMVMMMMITGIPVGKVKCRHKQGKTAHQLGSCLGGGSAGDECGEDDDYLHIQVKF